MACSSASGPSFVRQGAGKARWRARPLYRTGDVGEDLRVPIAAALLALYGPEETSERIAELVETMLPIELAELSPPPAM